MPPRRPTTSRTDDASQPSGGASRNERTEIKPSRALSRSKRHPSSVEVDEALAGAAQEPAEEYRTSNHYPGQQEEEPYEVEEGTPTPYARDATRMTAMDSLGEDDGDEGDDEAAEDDDNPDATRAGPPVSLHIIEGPDKGKKRRFKGVRMVVGRGKKIELKLSDQSVSRRHLELIHGDTGTLLRDLGTINGTLVNDEKVEEERLLKHGDEIAIGKTRIRYVDELEQVKQLRAEHESREAEAKKAEEEAKKKKEESAAARKAAAANATAASKEDVDPNDPRFNEATNARFVPPPGLREGGARGVRPGRGGGPKGKDTKVLIAGGVGVGVVVIAVVIILIMGNKEPPPPPPPDPRELAAATRMQQAKSAVRNGEFAEAVKLVEEAEKIIPGIDSEGLGKAARAEQTLAEAFQAVRSLMEEGRFEEARQQFKDLPSGTTAKSDEVRGKLQKELEEREVAFLSAKVEELLADRDVEGTRALLDRLPLSIQPLYRNKLTDLEEALAAEATEMAKQSRQSKALAAKLAAQQRAQFMVEAFDAVERKFDNGDYQRAVLECDRVIETHKGDAEIRDRAKNLKRLIPQFAKAFEDAQRKVQANSLESAVRPLKRSAELYQQIGFKGGLMDSINEQLAQASVIAGKAAMARNDVSSASRHFREALRLNPGDSRATQGLSSLEGQVEELYQRAYIERDRDPRSAAEKFKIVIDAAPEGSELKRKAQVHLDALQP